MTAMPPAELNQILRLIFALVFVVALMGGLGMVMRRVNGGRFARNIHKRLQIIEALPLDARRKLVLLRRDNVEHLVILGTNGETMVERGIESRQDTPHDSSASSSPAETGNHAA